MNRRNFIKWLGRLLAALPFVALVDLKSKQQKEDVIATFEPVDLWSQSLNEMLILPWGLEAPKEEVERLSKLLAETEEKGFWQRLLELDDDDGSIYVWKE